MKLVCITPIRHLEGVYESLQDIMDFEYHPNIKKHELKVNSDIAFKSLKNQIDELDLSFESQQWPVEILKYVLKELRENPIISSKIIVLFIIEHSNKSKTIKIEVPIKEKYINAFKSEVGFRDNYVEFLSDTYEFIMERL